MESNYFSFEKLAVWQESRTLVKEIYTLLRNFPVEEKFALCDQIRRAVVSVPSNIAEVPIRRNSAQFGAILCKKTMLCRHSERNFL